MSKKYVVTGGAGFIGSHIVDALIARGDMVVVIDDLSSGFRENISPLAEFHRVDIRDIDAVRTVFRGDIDGVFHCAAIVSVQYSLEHPKDTARINIDGTKNILQVSAETNVRRLVFCSSAAVYGNASIAAVTETVLPDPQSPYGIQKLRGEQECIAYATQGVFETVILRYFNVYGHRQRGDSSYAGVIALFVRTYLAHKSLTIFGDGSQTRDFINVSDVVSANLAAMSTAGISGQVFNIGSGTSTSVKELARVIGGTIEYAPARIEIRNSLADISKARHMLSWFPRIELREGIQTLVRQSKTQ